MKQSSQKHFYRYYSILLLSTLLLSCEKDDSFFKRNSTSKTIELRTDEQLLRDSIYYYYNLYSLWSDESIPDYNHLFRFTEAYQNNNEVLTALKSLTPAYSGYTQGVYDRFSYLQELNSSSSAAIGKLHMDLNNGYGISTSIGITEDGLAHPIIHFVEGGSPAALGGIRRGDVILELNDDKDLSIPVDCSTGQCFVKDPDRRSYVVNQILKAQSDLIMNIKVQHADGSIITRRLAYTTYDIDAVTHEALYLTPNKNVGYIALSSFEQIENNNQNQRHIDYAFQNFANHQIRDLIVDLRYNPGGYVDAAIYIANKIINKNGHQQLMLKYQVNKYLSENRQKYNFEDVYFQRSGQLELSTVYFLVTSNTASAAEMLINVLRPYMDIRIIADNTRTYGKPVGFFPQTIMHKTVLWPISFKLENAQQYGDYWLGLQADRTFVKDYIFRDFGDSKENMIAAALEESLPNYNNNTQQRSKRSSTAFEKVALENIDPIKTRGLIKTP
ncbi:S41 family peptidase [Sphingobacterium faecium]|uniref:S41 family peptidase n=1 Tax=Sphingobacterium faecium TaxID=34087 RepID=UPI003209C8D4